MNFNKRFGLSVMGSLILLFSLSSRVYAQSAMDRGDAVAYGEMMRQAAETQRKNWSKNLITNVHFDNVDDVGSMLSLVRMKSREMSSMAFN